MTAAERRTLWIGLVDPLPHQDLTAVTEEGERLMAFLEPGAEPGDVQFERLSTA